MPKKLTEAMQFDCIVPPQDVGTADVTGTWTNVSDCKRFVVLAKAGAVTAAKILTVQLRQAKDAAGTGAKDLGAPVTSVGAGGEPPRGRRDREVLGRPRCAERLHARHGGAPPRREREARCGVPRPRRPPL